MIKLTDIAKEILNEDRCKRIADRRYSKPSAYKSGAIVRCRKGNIWKGLKEITQNDKIEDIANAFVNSEIGKKYSKYDCKSVTRAFTKWAADNGIETKVITFAPPSTEFIKQNPKFKGKSGEGDGHIMPIVNDQAIDFTVRQFGVNRPYQNPLITPLNNIKSVYSKFGYFTNKPEWFDGGKTHWVGPLSSIPSDIFNQDFGDEILENIKEEIAAEEAHEDKNAIQTVLDGKRELGLISLKGSPVSAEKFWEIVKNNNLNTLQIPSNPFEMYIYYVDGAENKAKELKDIAEKYDGFLSYKATEEDSRRIGQLLGYKKEDIDDYIIKNKKIRGLDEAKKETLRTWFKRKGAAGKTGGWVDCNTCRKDKKTGRKKCKPCGRQKGEKRAKYPSCRPTPSQCGDPGKGKSWGKTK